MSDVSRACLVASETKYTGLSSRPFDYAQGSLPGARVQDDAIRVSVRAQDYVLFKANLLALNDGMLLEFRIVVQREIGAVLGAAAFLARQRRPGDQQRDLVNVGGLAPGAIQRLRPGLAQLQQFVDGALEL